MKSAPGFTEKRKKYIFRKKKFNEQLVGIDSIEHTSGFCYKFALGYGYGTIGKTKLQKVFGLRKSYEAHENIRFWKNKNIFG